MCDIGANAGRKSERALNDMVDFESQPGNLKRHWTCAIANVKSKLSEFFV